MNSSPPNTSEEANSKGFPLVEPPLEDRRRRVNATRLLAFLSILAFASFAWVDPFLISGQALEDAYIFRASLCLVGVGVLLASWTSWGMRFALLLGSFVGVYTGIGVAMLAVMTGGPAGSYWTMIMLCFFGVSLILPQKAWHAALSYTLVTVFYYVWSTTNDAVGEMGPWVVSLAGIGLANVVSVAGAAYIHGYRTREDEARIRLMDTNQQLLRESEEREKAEDIVRRTQQLDAVGRLSAGLAHELNNILAVISGTAESLDREMPEVKPQVARIVTSARMGARLTSDLLAFSREGKQEERPFSMKTLVTAVTDMLSRTYPRRIRTTLYLPERDAWVQGDQQRMSQAILNICLNGVHAIGGEGCLRLHMEYVGSSRLFLRVSDDGTGMSEDVLARAIEPFFTTRPPGQGTGLGLSMAYGTIRQHQGTLTLQSEEGKGTTVIVELPRLQEDPSRGAAPQNPTVSVQRPVSQGGKWVGRRALLADDDGLVRDVMEDFLVWDGFEVTSVANGLEAMKVVSEQESSFDLIVLDMVMPEMGGEVTFKEIRRTYPQVPILLYSGLSVSPDIQDLMGQTRTQFVQKPFTFEQFQQSIEKLMN